MSEKTKVLVVEAKRNGYRRAGLLFGESAVNIPVSTLTKHQIKELEHDRMLSVCEVELDTPSAADLLEMRRKEAIVDELIAALPADFVWTESPVEYIANLQTQLRVQTERASSLSTEVETLRATAADAAQSQAGISTTKPHGRK